MSSHLFSSLDLRSELLGTVDALGFDAMTSIQQQSLPLILQGRDVIAQGHTGSGKTAAFGIGALNAIDITVFKPQLLVLCPTRELSEQVASEIRRLARGIANTKVVTVYGGTAIKAQIDSLAKGAHIVVGTPGRIEDLLAKNSLALDHLRMFVLDEADRMLDMGFQKTVDEILQQLPRKRQTLLFSATFPQQIEQLAERVTQNAEFVKVSQAQDQVRIDERFYQVANEQTRQEALRLLLLEQAQVQENEQAVVFCNTRADAQTVAGGLKSAGFSAAALHGDMEQKDRDQTLIRFSNGSLNVLVATDVAARGLDIAELALVINYHLPKEIEVYTHRIGRTGRAGEKGTALSLFTKGEVFRMEKLAALTGRKTSLHELPEAQTLNQNPARAGMSTLRIEGGKKQKLRPGDLVGALTKGEGIVGDQLGKIQVMDNWAYIAVERSIAKQAAKKISDGKIKGKSFRCRLV